MSQQQTQPQSGRASQVIRQFLDFLLFDPDAARSYRNRLSARIGDNWVLHAFDCVLDGHAPAADLIDTLKGHAAVALDEDDAPSSYAYLELARRMAPEDQEVLHDWAIAQFRLGEVADAVAAFQSAITNGLASPQAALNTALALVAGGEAEAARALINPVADLPGAIGAQALLYLARLDMQMLDMETARTRLLGALEKDASNAQVMVMLATLEFAAEDYAEGAEWLRRASDVDPKDGDIQAKLGEMLFRARDFTGAEDAFRKAHALRGQDIDLAYIAHMIFRHRGAEAMWDEVSRLVKQAKSEKDFYSLFGHSLYSDYVYIDAIKAFQLAFVADPSDKSILTGIGAIMRQGGDSMLSRDFMEWAAETVPDIPEVWQGLGTTLYETGAHERSVAVLASAAERWPTNLNLSSTLVLAMHYLPGASVAAIREAAERLADAAERKYAAEIPAWQPPAAPQTDGRLAVGFMSGGFRNHPVGHFARGLLLNIDRSRFRVVLLDSGTERDQTTDLLFSHADEVVDLTLLSDPLAVARARSLNLDVFIDLAGCFQGARLALPVGRVAPVQMKWVGGLCGTTGVRQFDYVISDPIESPPGAEDGFVEKAIYRLPNDYVTFTPPSYNLPVTPLPALRNGHVTFGCLNNYAKLNGPLLDCWAAILRATPDSRMILLSQPYGNAKVVQAVTDEFSARGIGPERIECIGTRPHRVVMETYGRIDIALDPAPYSGGLTTCEALYMGVPVITVPGETFASRHSATHLVNIGMGDLVCPTLDSYTATAVGLAQDHDRLAGLRASLRGLMEASPLMDHQQFARDFEAMLFAVTGRSQ